MPPPLLTLKGIDLTFGGTELLNGAELSVEAGDRLCLVGRNGSGKSTLLKIAAGLVDPDRGERFVHPNAVVRYLTQEPDFEGYETAIAYVEAGLSPLQSIHSAELLLGELGLEATATPATLSGGEGRRLALARVIAAEPDVMLLDEPTNHLDLPAIEWLEARLKQLKTALVLISHDRRFLEALARTTVWIDRGQTRVMNAGFAGFEDWRDTVLEQEELERHKLDRKIVRENEWMHGGVTGRRKRNVRRVRELRAMREDVSNQRDVQGNVRLAAADGGTSSRLIAEAKAISKSFGDKAVVSEFSTRILRGDRLAIIGPNGAGKTTLLKMLTGALAPDSGTIRLGESLELVTLDQRRDELRPDWTLAQALTGGRGDQVVINGRPRHVASYMKDFLFTPEQTRSPLRVLSGGERARLMLARALAKPSNVLVLDEPTNDLDLETLDLLQELLADYTGTVILISHDRDFLDRVATSVIASEGDGIWLEYAGGYSDLLAQRRARERAPTVEAKAATAGSKAATPAVQATASAKRKLSFKEKHALETLPSRIAELEAKASALKTKLADPKLYTANPAEFASASKALAETETALAKAEDDWLALELLREELGV